MAQRILVKVVGFSDVERHSLNTLFRLSDERDPHYGLWAPGAPEPARLALVDAFSHEAHVEAESQRSDSDLKVIWIGSDAPAQAWRAFPRPLRWSPVVQAMDQLFAPAAGLDLDLGDIGAAVDFDIDTGAGALEPLDASRALIAHPKLEERLYLRAKLALSGRLLADDAVTAIQALAKLKFSSYAVTILDFDMPDMDGWQLLQKAVALKSATSRLIVTTRDGSRSHLRKLQGAGADVVLPEPLDPVALKRALSKK